MSSFGMRDIMKISNLCVSEDETDEEDEMEAELPLDGGEHTLIPAAPMECESSNLDPFRWQGGYITTKPIIRGKAYVSTFNYSRKQRIARRFSFVNCSKEEALRLAREWLIDITTKNRKLKNRWRNTPNKDIIEIELNAGQITKIDLDEFERVRTKIWTARYDNITDSYYAMSGKTRLHTFIKGYRLTSHGDKDTLNNCKINLFDKSITSQGRAARLAMKNSTGIVGIYAPTGRQSYMVQWNKDGKTKSTSFSWIKFGSKEVALAKANEFKQARNLESLQKIKK